MLELHNIECLVSYIMCALMPILSLTNRPNYSYSFSSDSTSHQSPLPFVQYHAHSPYSSNNLSNSCQLECSVDYESQFKIYQQK